eukprot:CAMPEP_0118929726 /NCGR_PEP_ID=MMETSP1169-20130426/6647_1 /TAXON_ID=36882 /ORGANISM="Pyramimonas obovata, Strain CCMP722" /LENGTH=424 /DNA_ID=CAMNT_0006871973 /DNA_START=87 /DNA_END=1358 /DNA_ORIENTATION=-
MAPKAAPQASWAPNARLREAYSAAMTRIRKEHMSNEGNSFLKGFLLLLPMFMHKDQRKTWHWVLFSVLLVFVLGVILEGAVGLEHLLEHGFKAVAAVKHGAYIEINPTGNASAVDETNEYGSYSFPLDLMAPEDEFDPCMPKKPENATVLGIWGGSAGMGFFAYPLFVINHILYAKRAGYSDFFVYFDCKLGNAYCEEAEKSRDMWKVYFEPVSKIRATRRMNGQHYHFLKKNQLWSLHRECNQSVRSYYYGTAEYLIEDDTFLDDWYYYNRQLASQALKEHIVVRKSVLDHANMFWTRKGLAAAGKVLGVHMRGTDKAEIRRKVPPAEYLPYVNGFLKAFPGSLVFLATDSADYLEEFLAQVTNATRVVHTQSKRSSVNVFRDQSANARTVIGRQVLTDALLLSKCDFLLKSDSAVSEFSIYW